MRRLGIGATILALAAGMCALPVTLPASPISGTFNIDGVITVTGSTIAWQSNAGVVDEGTIATAGLTGSFTGLGNTSVTIQNLSNPPGVVGAAFPSQPFIGFASAPSTPALDINFIFPGLNSSAGCAASPAGGQTCTPPIPGGSPFSLTNLGTPGGAVVGSAALFTFAGVTSDGLSTWTGNFTSQFGVPFQSVLADLSSNGSVTNTYSGTLLVSPVSAIPEPATAFLLGGSLVGLAFLRRKASASR